jgi:hypothetical protein
MTLLCGVGGPAAVSGREEEALAREADNLVLLLAYLYDFGAVACGLVSR